MSFTEMIQEIPKLSHVERQSLMLELKRQAHIEASNEFAQLFEGVQEIEMWTPVVSNEDMDYFMRVHEEDKGKLL
jgi:hypothetical protein